MLHGFEDLMFKTDGMLTVGGALRGLPWDDTERGANAAEAVSSPTSSSCPSPFGATSALWANLTKYGVTIWCAACSDIALHGKTAKAHTDECRARIGEQMEHDPERHERLQLHKRRQDAEREVEGARAPVVREIAGDPALLAQHDVEMLVEVSGESASVTCGADVAADIKGRARLRL